MSPSSSPSSVPSGHLSTDLTTMLSMKPSITPSSSPSSGPSSHPPSTDSMELSSKPSIAPPSTNLLSLPSSLSGIVISTDMTNPNFDSKNAKDACCVCDGSVRNSSPSQLPSLGPSKSIEPSNELSILFIHHLLPIFTSIRYHDRCCPFERISSNYRQCTKSNLP